MDTARERGLAKKQMDFYRKMTAGGKTKESIDLDTGQLENLMSDFTKNLKDDLQGSGEKGGKSSLVIKKEGGSVKFDQASLLSSIKNEINSGNEGVIKRVNRYNIAQNLVEKKVILEEIKNIISDLDN